MCWCTTHCGNQPQLLSTSSNTLTNQWFARSGSAIPNLMANFQKCLILKILICTKVKGVLNESSKIKIVLSNCFPKVAPYGSGWIKQTKNVQKPYLCSMSWLKTPYLSKTNFIFFHTTPCWMEGFSDCWKYSIDSGEYFTYFESVGWKLEFELICNIVSTKFIFCCCS